jgi:hypothetical protein
MAQHATELAQRISEEEVRQHLAEVVASSHFSHAPQLRHFLGFLVESVLDGREDELKEANLGRDVFRRGPGYDPRSDAIVRVQASILRKRLCCYYENEGKDSPIRISLPKGGYVPNFERLSPPEPRESNTADELLLRAEPSLPAEPPITPTTGDLPSRRGILAVAASLVAGAVLTTGAQKLWDAKKRSGITLPPPTFDAKHASPRIWGHLLDSRCPTQLAFGCPQFFSGGGLYLRDVGINSVDEITSAKLRDLADRLQVFLTPTTHTYTGVGEMLGIHRMTQFLSYRGVDAPLSNVQLLTRESLENKNFILVSSYRFRTMLDLLELPRQIEPNFQDRARGGFAVKDANGRIEEIYCPRNSGGLALSYCLISFWKHPYTDGQILVLSGIESWATYAAAQYITSEPHLRALEASLGNNFSDKDKGLQVLVQLDGHDEHVVTSRYLTHRVLA